jgi:hypothetical protein
MPNSLPLNDSFSAAQPEQDEQKNGVVISAEAKNFERELKKQKKQLREDQEKHKYHILPNPIFRAEVLHLETLNMMTKYQLVFIKLETAVAKMMRIRKMRLLMEKQKAFERYRQNIKFIIGFQGYKARVVLQKVKHSINRILLIYNSKHQLKIEKAFKMWKMKNALFKESKLFEKKNLELQERNQKILKEKENQMEQVQQKLEHHVQEVAALKSSENSLKQIIHEKEEKEMILKESLEKAKKSEDKRNQKGVDERLNALEVHVKTLQSENEELRAKLDATENNVGDFISEMSTLLDSHDFASNFRESFYRFFRAGTRRL